MQLNIYLYLFMFVFKILPLSKILSTNVFKFKVIYNKIYRTFLELHVFLDRDAC